MIKFGPSGNSDSFYQDGYKSSLQAPHWVKNKGLSAYEYSFSRGFHVKDDVLESLGNQCKSNGLTLSVHAPYYINLANPDPQMIEKSFNYIITSLKKLKLMQGTRCVFHPGSCGKLSREEAIELMNRNMQELVKRISKEKLDFKFMLCPETMGKEKQIGTYEEVARLCKYADYLVPTLDFGHINCILQGKLKTEEDYEEIFNFLIDELGYEKVKNIHIHFSKIEYGSKGEIKHLTFEDTIYGPEFEPLSRVLKKLKIEPVIICESKGKQVEDAITMKNIYEND